MNINKFALVLCFITTTWSVEGQAHGGHGGQGFHASHQAFRSMERPINREEVNLDEFHGRHKEALPTVGSQCPSQNAPPPCP